MAWIVWVGLIGIGVVAIFVLGFMTGETAETQASRQRNKRQAARERKIRTWQREIDATLREIDAVNRASLDRRVGELRLVALKPPVPLGRGAEQEGED